MIKYGVEFDLQYFMAETEEEALMKVKAWLKGLVDSPPKTIKEFCSMWEEEP